MKARRTVAVLALTMMLLGLAVPGLAQEKVEITLWHHWTGHRTEWVQEMLDKFMEEYPWIEAKQLPAPTAGRVERLTNFLISGASPELVQVASGYAGGFMAQGGFLRLDEFIARDGVDLGMFNVGDLRGFQLHGETYALPVMSGAAWTNLMIYNKDMMSEVGLPDTAPTTWSEWREAALRMTRKDESGMTLRGGTSIPLIHVATQWNDDSLWSDDWRTATVGGPRTLETATILTQLANDVYGGYREFRTFFDQRSFYNQDYGIWFINNSVFGFLKDQDFRWGAAVAPVNEAQPNARPVGLVTSTWAYAIPSNIPQEKREAAWLLLKYLTTEEEAAGWFARIQGRPCPVVEFNKHPDYIYENPEWANVIRAVENDIAAPPVDLHNLLEAIEMRILNEEITPAQGFADMQLVLQDALDTYWAGVE